jgi:hypothetical protein
MDWGEVLVIVASVAGIVGFFFTWMNGNITRLDGNIIRLDSDLKAIMARMDANNAAINARVDQTQAIIMRMLEKKGM